MMCSKHFESSGHIQWGMTLDLSYSSQYSGKDKFMPMMLGLLNGYTLDQFCTVSYLYFRNFVIRFKIFDVYHITSLIALQLYVTSLCRLWYVSQGEQFWEQTSQRPMLDYRDYSLPGHGETLKTGLKQINNDLKMSPIRGGYSELAMCKCLLHLRSY